MNDLIPDIFRPPPRRPSRLAVVLVVAALALAFAGWLIALVGGWSF